MRQACAHEVPWRMSKVNWVLGSNAVLKIELDGSNAGDASGLVIAAQQCQVRALVINRFQGAGILIYRFGTRANVVRGNFIGTDVTGSAALGNTFAGVTIGDAHNNTIGGSQLGRPI